MYAFTLDFKVRDYECDLQGIVNNSVYQNYLEHTRHEFISWAGMDFADMHRQGIDAVVSRIEIDYKIPLCPGDEFTCCLNVARQGKLRIVFEQDIIRKSDNAMVLRAKVYAAVISEGRPQPLDKVLGPLLAYLPE
jgi:acyl-CoA thioester hydrolase